MTDPTPKEKWQSVWEGYHETTRQEERTRCLVILASVFAELNSDIVSDEQRYIVQEFCTRLTYHIKKDRDGE